MTTTDEAVAKIAEVMADAESKAGTIRAKVRGLKDEFEAIHSNGDAGYLASKGFFTSLDALVTQFESDLYSIHGAMTDYAQDRGIDLPSVEGGGGR